MASVRFTIYPHRWISKGKRITKDLYPTVYKAFRIRFDFFDHEKLKGIEIQYNENNIVIIMSEMYCYPLNTILGLEKDQPQCLKMGKRATAFLNQYKRIVKYSLSYTL
jgi:hypothetical protein